MSTSLCTLALLTALGPQSPPSDELLVRADRIVLAPGTVLENDAILIRGGVVALVGQEIPAAARSGVRVVELKGTVVPGFVNPHSHLGLGNDLAERITALTPELRAADAFDPFDEMLERNRAHGVTTIGLAPLSANTFAGVAAVVKAGEIGEVIADNSYLKLALVAESLDQNRYPTSRMGAADLIRSSFEAAQLALDAGDAKAQALRNVLSGATRLAIHARTHGAITAALDLCQELNVTPLLIGADEVEQSLTRLAAMGGSVILNSLRPTDKLPALQLPGVLEAAGIPMSFTADHPALVRSSPVQGPMIPGLPPGVVILGAMPSSRSGRAGPAPGHPENLRMTAALAIRHGLSRRAALAALTRTPAMQCGVEARCGNLRQGADADFAVFSGDPLDLSSRLTAVYVGGKRIDPQ